MVGNGVAPLIDPIEFNAVWYIRNTKLDVVLICVPNDGKDYMGLELTVYSVCIK